jgi:hypothetical protein
MVWYASDALLMLLQEISRLPTNWITTKQIFKIDLMLNISYNCIMSFNTSSKVSSQHTAIFNRILYWIKNNILLILAPALLASSGHLFYDLGRLVSHILFNGPSDFLNISMPFERGIQLNDADSWLVIPYFLAYVYWVVMPFIINYVLGKRAFYRFFAANVVANIIGFFVWAFLPTRQDPNVYKQAYLYIYGAVDSTTVSGHGLIGSLLGMVYGGDCPDNLSPSQHNNMTFLCFLIFLFPSEKTNRRHGKWIAITGCIYALVGTATIFIRQHAILDILTGIGITSCAALFIGDHIKFDIFLSKLFDRFHANIFKTRVLSKTCCAYKVAFIGWVLLWTTIVGIGLYASAIMMLTGDPFKSIWYSDAWSPQNYMIS